MEPVRARPGIRELMRSDENPIRVQVPLVRVDPARVQAVLARYEPGHGQLPQRRTRFERVLDLEFPVRRCEKVRVRAHGEGFASFRRAVADMWLNLANSRLMTDSLTNPKYKSWMMCARAMWAEGGARVRVLPLFLLLRLE